MNFVGETRLDVIQSEVPPGQVRILLGMDDAHADSIITGRFGVRHRRKHKKAIECWDALKHNTDLACVPGGILLMFTMQVIASGVGGPAGRLTNRIEGPTEMTTGR